MKFTILKNGLNNKLHSLNLNPVNIIKTDFHKITHQKDQKLTIQNLDKSAEIEKKGKANSKIYFSFKIKLQ